MRVVLDTNVVISGIFFGGIPGRILESWREGELQLVFSPRIFEEYRRVAEILETKHGPLEIMSILALLLSEGVLVQDSELPEPVCDDPDDDKFLACALTSGTTIIVSGDRDLLDLDRYEGIDILTPREFQRRMRKEAQ